MILHCRFLFHHLVCGLDGSGEYVLAIGAERPPFVTLSVYIFGKPILVFIVTITEAEISLSTDFDLTGHGPGELVGGVVGVVGVRVTEG